MHKRYEELCALAATGQIDARKNADLQEHLKSCGGCRAFLDDAKLLGKYAPPILAANCAQRADVQPPGGIRERFLQRGLAEGFHVSPGPVLAGPSELDNSIGSKGRARAVNFPALRQIWLRIPPIEPVHAAFTVAACALFAILGYMLAAQRYSAHVPVPTAALYPKANSAKVSQPDATQDALRPTKLEQQIRTLSAELLAAETAKQELSKRLEDLARQAAAGAHFEQQFKNQAKSLQDSEDEAAELKSALDQAQKKQSELDAILIAQQQATQDANAKLAKTEAELRNQQDLQSARSEVGELISARNLHIVDVRDTEHGSRRPFGRVFYVEGQSLIFYAYDLSAAAHASRKIAFHVWGETAGVKETTYSLGMLHSDDTRQARWVLTFDDPKVLNRINAVYITADQDTKTGHEPEGRKLLYAFLGTPNHP